MIDEERTALMIRAVLHRMLAATDAQLISLVNHCFTVGSKSTGIEYDPSILEGTIMSAMGRIENFLFTICPGCGAGTESMTHRVKCVDGGKDVEVVKKGKLGIVRGKDTVK